MIKEESNRFSIRPLKSYTRPSLYSFPCQTKFVPLPFVDLNDWTMYNLRVNLFLER